MRKLFIPLVAALLCGCVFPLAAQDAEAQARAYLLKNSTQLGLSTADLSDLLLTNEYTDTHTGVTHLYLRQRYQGIEISAANLDIHFSGEGRMVAMHQKLVKNLAQSANATQASISQAEAVVAAATALNIGIDQTLVFGKESPEADRKTVFPASGLSLREIPVRLTYHVQSNGSLRLAWNLQIYELTGQHWWNVWVDAENGKLLHREDWVAQCQWENPLTGSLCTEDHVHETAQTHGPGVYRVYPMPYESPNHGPHTLLGDPSDPLASPYGWHDTNGQNGAEFTITRGNNVYTADDINADDQPGTSPDGGSGLVFDFPVDLTQAPSTYLTGASVNLFYWNNIMHDVWYQYGFDEAGGNFQQTNYSGTGLGDDYVRADAQDGSGFNNANFGTPPDGQNPRMQMYIWTNGSSTSQSLTINSPASIAGIYNTGTASFGPGLPSSPLTADVVIAQDAAGSSLGCNPLTNTAAMAGKIAIIDRGTCSFVIKVKNAQNAGAVAVIIANNNAGGPPALGGSDPTITIPSLSVTQSDGASIKSTLNSGLPVNATIQNTGVVNGFDSGLDNGVIAHEYTHGISNRLTGGPANASCLSNEEQAGEGWSDWFALVMTVESGDNGPQARGIGTYVSNEPVNGGGIRPFPYSTNMSINPVTYDDIKTLSVPHGVGSVMCSMLWDLYWELVEVYGYDSDIYQGNGGNNMAMQLVIDGLKLQPCSPGFTDVRDAILLADELNYNGANKCLIWEVFARRGLGYSADQGSSASRSDGTEGYDLPPACRAILYMEKTVSREKVPAGDTLTYTLRIANQTTGTLTGVFVADTLPENISYVAGTSSCSASEFGNVLLLQLGTLAPGQQVICTFQAQVDANSPVSVLIKEDGIEDAATPYSVVAQTGTGFWRRDSLDPRSGKFALFVPNEPALNDQLITIPPFTPDSGSVFSFWHKFTTEDGWDGGFVEIFPANQGIWLDMEPYFIQNPYNSVVGSNNPVGERSAFGGNSNGWIQTRADLSSFEGQTVLVRFRFVSDDNTNETGWFIDDILLGSEQQRSNRACVSAAEGNSFCSTQPFPNIITEGDTTTLGAPGFSDLGVDVYPNPAQDKLVVEVKKMGAEGMDIRMLDAVGKEVRSLRSAGSERVSLPVSDLARGIYVLEVRSGSRMARLKIVLQ